jgi:hypothetical protein
MATPNKLSRPTMSHPTIPLANWNRYRQNRYLAKDALEAVVKAEQHLDQKEGNKIILTNKGKPFSYVVSYGEGYEYDRIPK